MPLIPLTVALTLGILVGSLVWRQMPFACGTPLFPLMHAGATTRLLVGLLALGLLPLAHLWRRARPRYGLYLLYAGLGLSLYLASPFTPCLPADHVGALAARLGEQGETVTLTGVIDGWPDVRPYGTLYRLRAEQRHTFVGDVPLVGDVLLHAPRYPAYEYGDRVRVVGVLQQPPVFDTFDYRRYLARKGIHAVLRADRIIPIDGGHGHPFWRVLYRVRAHAAHIIDRTLPEPYAALSNGILLGIESGIPRRLYDDFNATGTSHIIVISGFNIAIIAGLLLALLVPLLGERRAGVVAIVGIAVYVLFVGADAAVVRAGLMGMVYAGSRVVRRQGHVLNTLALSAFLMLLFNPLTLWDLGFQLSFLATLGLIVLHPALERPVRRVVSRILPRRWRKPLLDVLNEALIVTLAAQLTTTPLIIAVFGRVSLISLLTNALILPVQPLVMIGAGLSTLAGMLWLPLGQLLALVPLLPLAWTVTIVRKTAAWPGAGMSTPSWLRPLVVAYYGVLALYVVAYYRRVVRGRSDGGSRRWRGKVKGWRLSRVRLAFPAAVLLLATGTLLVGLAGAFSPPPLTLSLSPGGEAALRAESGPTVVVPSGEVDPWGAPSARTSVWVLTEVRPSLLVALRLRLQETPPALVIYPQACLHDDRCRPSLAPFLRTLDARGIRRASASPGQWMTLGRRLQAVYLDGGEGNTYPILLRHGTTRILLPANIPVAVQEQLNTGNMRGVIWPLPLPQGGTWPVASFLERARPGLLLYPSGVTYPPAASDALAAYPSRTYAPEERWVLRLDAGR